MADNQVPSGEPTNAAAGADAAASPAAPPAEQNVASPGASPKDKGNDSTNMNMSKSMPNFGSYDDLKTRTQFSEMTSNGVVKGPTYTHAISGKRTGQRWSFGQKGPSAFISSSNTPAPGTYNAGNEEKTKYQNPPKFSFGGGSRFGLSASPTKKSPGPGAYNPKDPVLLTAPKVGFGGSGPARGPKLPEPNPGPGAYEQRSTLGKGLMFTARGRHPVSYMRARSLPGPGAYEPKTNSVFMSQPKCGFGTSTRSDIAAAARNLVMPGPGTYETQQAMGLGKDAPKYSATSRRRQHDLNSYVTPGPGTYNAHTTSFEPLSMPPRPDSPPQHAAAA